MITIPEKRIKNVSIGLPLSWPYIPFLFFNSWTAMIAQSITKFNIHIIMSSATLIETMREEIAKKFLEHGDDCLIWIDADQIYPPETLIKLVADLETGREIVGGVTPLKNSGYPSIWTLDKETGLYNLDKDFEVNRGLIKVDVCGGGGLAVSRSVYERIKPPYYERMLNYDKKSLLGEDLSFFRRCQEKNISVWCDTDLLYQHIMPYAISVYDPLFLDWNKLELREKEK